MKEHWDGVFQNVKEIPPEYLLDFFLMGDQQERTESKIEILRRLYAYSDGDLLVKLQAPKKLYHCTTPKKARLYRHTGKIIAPVRGFDTLQAAMLWCMKTGRSVIYEIVVNSVHKLPDHHNQFGEAWWSDDDVPVDNIKCILSVSGEIT